MAKILTYNSPSGFEKKLPRDNLFKTVYEWFNSQERYAKFFILTALLILIATPFIVNNLLETRQRAAGTGEYSAEALKTLGLHKLGANEYAIVRTNTGKTTGKPVKGTFRLKNGQTITLDSTSKMTASIIEGSDKESKYVKEGPDVTINTYSSSPQDPSSSFASILTNSASPTKKVKQTSVHKSQKSVCDKPEKGKVKCLSHVITDDSLVPLAGSTPPSGSYGPIQFHIGYNLPCTPGGVVQSVCSQPGSFGGQTIGIVDAFDDPTVEQDLGIYSQQYGLPPCTRANGCLTVVNQTGGSTLPTPDTGWGLEISLDVQTAHAVCQTCKILLVEANSNFDTDLVQAVNEAATLGATEISNSWGGDEDPSETAFDSSFNHPGVAITASSGDSGEGSSWPSAVSTVVSVGGTTLHLNADNTYSSESAWSLGGSGCSPYESANAWQVYLPNWGLTGCGTHRGAVDVSADADVQTGAAVYDTAYSGWLQVGGTSLSSPLVASVIALGGGTSGVANAQQIPYFLFNSQNSHDITTGSNGSCSGSMCNAGPGYDGPTGLGSPNGINGFKATLIKINQTPSFWGVTSDPTVQASSSSQTLSIKTSDNTISSLSAVLNINIPGVTGSLSKNTLNVANGATDSFTVTIAYNNDQAKPGNYSGNIVYSQDGTDIGTAYFGITILPTLTVSPPTIDYGVDDPSLSSWTSGTQTSTITNLRKDISQTVSVSSSGYPAGVTLTVPASVTIPAGGTSSLNTSIAVNNSSLGNNIYNGVLNLTGSANTIQIPAKFTKFYVLNISGGNTIDFLAGIWMWVYDQSTHAVYAYHSITSDPQPIYLNSPGPYDVIVRYHCNTPAPCNWGIDFKEGISISGGQSTVTTLNTDLTNLVQLVPTDISGQVLTNLPSEGQALYNSSAELFLIGNWTADGYNISPEYYSNFSTNYTAQNVFQAKPTQTAIYNFDQEFTGLTGNLTTTNTAADFKQINVHLDTDLPPVPVTIYGSPLEFCMPRAAVYFSDNCNLYNYQWSATLPLRQTVYTIAPATAYLQYGVFNGLTGVVDKSPDINNASPLERWAPIFGPDYHGYGLSFPSMENNTQYVGLGPTIFVAKFLNTPTIISLIDYFHAYGTSVFPRQDYSFRDWPDTPYTISQNGNQIVAGKIPSSTYSSINGQFNKISSVNVPSAGPYQFATNFPYTDKGLSMSGKVTANFDTSKTDPNPPTIKRLYYYANNFRSEVYDPTVANRLDFEVDPIGGSIASTGVSYSTDGTNFTPVTVNNANGVYSANIPSASGTKMTLKITAADDSANSLSYTFELPISVLDRTLPTVSITSPTNGANVSESVNVTANASDNVGVTNVEFYVDGSYKGNSNTSPYSFSWKTRELTNGSHTLIAKAYDAAGNVSTSSTVSVNVANADITSPDQTITSPASGSTVSGSVPISVTATDNVGVTKVEIWISNTLVGTDTTSPYNFTWDSTKVPNGSYNIFSKAYDAAGNGRVTSVNVTVANGGGGITPSPIPTPTFVPITQPGGQSNLSVSLTQPSNGAIVPLGKTIVLKADATDTPGVNITKVEFYVNGARKCSDTSSPYTCNFKVGTTTGAIYTITAKAYDITGNTKVSSPSNVTGGIDTVFPSVTLTNPVNGAQVTVGTVTPITATATDTVGISKVEFYVNGTRKCSDNSSPYSCNWTVPTGTSISYTLNARAYDFAGNISNSSIVVTSR